MLNQPSADEKSVDAFLEDGLVNDVVDPHQEGLLLPLLVVVRRQQANERPQHRAAFRALTLVAQVLADRLRRL